MMAADALLVTTRSLTRWTSSFLHRHVHLFMLTLCRPSDNIQPHSLDFILSSQTCPSVYVDSVVLVTTRSLTHWTSSFLHRHVHLFMLTLCNPSDNIQSHSLDFILSSQTCPSLYVDTLSS